MADVAHYAGLIFTGSTSPVGIADFVTTTNDDLRGPRGGMNFGSHDQEKAINRRSSRRRSP